MSMSPELGSWAHTLHRRGSDSLVCKPVGLGCPPLDVWEEGRWGRQAGRQGSSRRLLTPGWGMLTLRAGDAQLYRPWSVVSAVWAARPLQEPVVGPDGLHAAASGQARSSESEAQEGEQHFVSGAVATLTRNRTLGWS